MKRSHSAFMQFHRYRYIVVFAIVALTAALALVLSEIYLRHTAAYVTEQAIRKGSTDGTSDLIIRDTSKGKRLIPNMHLVIHNHYTSRQTVRMDTNSLGFRDRELSKRKEGTDLRILALGDSSTFGDYLPAEEVYVEKIQDYLNRSVKHRRIEVVNGGLGDIGLREEVDILSDPGLRVEPDIVLLGFYLNDSRPPSGFPGERGRRGWLRRHSRLAETLYRNMKLSRWIREKGEYRFRWIGARNTLDWAHRRSDFFKLVSMAADDWGAAWEKDSWRIVDKEFDRLVSISKKHRFTVVVVALPVFFQVYSDFIEDTPQRILREKASRRGFYFFDLLPLLRLHRQKRLYFDHCHPTTTGNDIIGKAIADFLREEVLSSE